MRIQSSKKISITALFTAFAVILSYVETFIPMIGIPGVKLGLANFAIVLALYFLGYSEAVLINVIRIIIIGAFFGNWFSILFSIVGALVSFLAMAVFKKTGRVSMETVAIAGGVFHNLGQIVVAAFVVDNYSVYSYIPALIVSGIITGCIIGIVSDIVYKRTKSFIDKI